jgi:hypothetical protein
MLNQGLRSSPLRMCPPTFVSLRIVSQSAIASDQHLDA